MSLSSAAEAVTGRAQLSASSSEYGRPRAVSDLTSENTSIVTSKTKEMPITRSVERHAASLPNSPQRNYVISSHLGAQFDEHDAFNGKGSTRRALEAQRKSMLTPKTPTSTLTVPHPSMPRRSVTGDHSLPMRGRANTDIPAPTATGGSRQQGSSLNGSSSERVVNQHGSATVKPKCILPTTTCQPGYVTPSKLFNMMGYGIQNQYLFMLAHYLYIIDCRPREKFNESHIVTAIHWEDALNGSVYISFVERFSEIVLYDEKGIFFNTTTEMRRVSNKFSNNGTKMCVTLSGGFEAFHTFYPFVCTQNDIRSIIDREKFLTIYPSVVLDNQLYIGSGYQGTNWKILRDLKVTHVINVSIEHQCPFPERIKYLHIELEDVEDVSLKDHFEEAIRFIESALEYTSNRVLVHCNLGISRSSTIVLAFLMKTYNATLVEAFKFLRHRRPVVCPNVGFIRQLIDFERELFTHAYSDPNDPLFR